MGFSLALWLAATAVCPVRGQQTSSGAAGGVDAPARLGGGDAPARVTSGGRDGIAGFTAGSQSHRVVKVFNFEERAEGNFEDMPRYWFVVTGPSYPRYTADQTGFDAAVAHSGTHSLKMKLDGGSAALVLQTGAMAAIPGADYIVIASIQTRNVVHSRARISGWFVDQHGRAVERSSSSSELVRSNGQWTTVRFRLNGDYPDAAWIILRLELLQEEEFVHSTLDKHELHRQDLNAAAWFDDVAVYQLPRLDVTTDNPVNIIRAPESPRLNVLVHDLTGEKLTSVVRLYDQQGRQVDTQLRTLTGRESPSWTWQPRIERFGWYWAELDVHTAGSSDGLVGRRTAAFLYLPARQSMSLSQSQHFGLVAEQMPPEVRPLLPQMIERIGCGAVVTDVWNPATTADDLDNMRTQPDAVIDALLKRRLLVSLSLSGVPAPLAELAKADADKPWALLADDPKYWREDLKAALVRYGQQVHRWQIGAATDEELFWRPGGAGEYAKLARWFAEMAPRAQVVAPWPAHLMRQSANRAMSAMIVNVPASIAPDQIGGYLASLGKTHGQTDVLLRSLGLKDYDHAQREQDLAMRLIESWSSTPGSAPTPGSASHSNPPRTVYLSSPWVTSQSRHPTLVPDPVLGVFACAMDRLAGRRVVAELPIQPGVRCLILEDDDSSNPRGAGTGALALWLEQAEQSRVPVAMYLGEKPEQVDLFGNRTPLPTRDGVQHFVVTASPMFIEGVDTKLIRFRAAMRFAPAVVQSSYQVHPLTLGIANPWNHPITGRLKLTGLPDWDIRPRVIPFTITSGGATVVPMELTFPISETAGEKRITGSVELEGERNFQLDVSIPLTIGLKDIELHTTLTLEPQRAGACPPP
ncbi:MAG: hypothetical protein ACYC26_17775, partial [Phycisphaerales bacterium]